MMGHAFPTLHATAGGGISPAGAAALTAAGLLYLELVILVLWWALRGSPTPPTKTKTVEVARRCSLGCANWPDEDAFKTCPGCGEPTTRIRETPMDRAEAISRKRRADFERQYGPAEVT